MVIFLVLLPFGVFSALMLLSSADMALFAAAVTGLAVIAWDHFRGRQLKMLGAGSVVLFLGLGGYLTLIDAGLSASAIKLTVDVGVLAIALVSLAIASPSHCNTPLKWSTPKPPCCPASSRRIISSPGPGPPAWC